MLAQGLVLLQDADTDAPDLPAVCTVSQDTEWESGAYAIGAAAADRGALWCDRPYFTGNPTVEWAVERVLDVAADGGRVQLGNELNLALENWVGGPGAYDVFYAAVSAASGQPVLYAPPSPGVPGWQEWIVRDDAPAYAVHAYGSFDQMRAVVQYYLDTTTGELYITECNFGAGNAVDVDAWAADHLVPFLDWCATEPRILLVAYFAWTWDQSASLPTSIDAKGTSIADVLSAWVPRPPMNGGSGEADIELSVPTAVVIASPANYDPGPRTATRGVVIHTTRGGAASPQAEYEATVNWFANPAAGVSAHLVVGPAEVARCVHDQDVAWHARTANQDHLGIEIAQATISTPISDAQYAAAAEACRLWAERYGFPLERVMSEAASGLVGHEDTESGRADGKSDPGIPPAGIFSWDYFLSLCRETPAPYDIDAARDQVWALADEVEAAGWPWFGQNLKAAVALSKGDK